MNWRGFNNNYNNGLNNNVRQRHQMNHHDPWAGNGNNTGNMNSPYMYQPNYNPYRNGKAGSPVNNAKSGLGGHKYPDYRNRYKNDIMGGSLDAARPHDNGYNRGASQGFNNNPYGMNKLGGSPGRLGAVGGINGGFQGENQHNQHGRGLSDRRNMEQMMPNRNGNFSERYRGIFGDYPQNGYSGVNNNNAASGAPGNNGFGAANAGSPGKRGTGLGGSSIGSQGNLHGYNRQNDMMRRTLPSVGNGLGNYGQNMRISGTDRPGMGGNQGYGRFAGNNRALDSFSNDGSARGGARDQRFSHETVNNYGGARNDLYGAGAGNNGGYLMPGQYNENDYGRPKSVPRNNRFNHFSQHPHGGNNANNRLGANNRIGGSAMRGAAMGGNQGAYPNRSHMYDNHMNGSPLSQRGGGVDNRHYDRMQSPGRAQNMGQNLGQNLGQNMPQISRLNAKKSPVRRLGDTHSPRSPGRTQIEDYGNINNMNNLNNMNNMGNLGNLNNHNVGNLNNRNNMNGINRHVSPSRNTHQNNINVNNVNTNNNRSPGRSPGRVLEDYKPRVVEEVNPVARLQGMSPSRMGGQQNNASPLRNTRESHGASPMRPTAAFMGGSPGRNMVGNNDNNGIGSPRRVGQRDNFSPINIRKMAANTDINPAFEARRLEGLSPRRNVQNELMGSPSRRQDFSNNHPFNHIRPARTHSIENLNDPRENYPVEKGKNVNDPRGIRRSPIVVHKGPRHPLQESNLNKIRKDQRSPSPKKFDNNPTFHEEKIVNSFGAGMIRDQQDATVRRVTRINNFTEKTEFLQEPNIKNMEQGLPYQGSPAKPTITLRADGISDKKRPMIFDKNFPNYRERYGNIVSQNSPQRNPKYPGRIIDKRNLGGAAPGLGKPPMIPPAAIIPPASQGPAMGPVNDAHVPKLTNYVPPEDDIIYGYDVPEPPTLNVPGGSPGFKKPPIPTQPVQKSHSPVRINRGGIIQRPQQGGSVAPPYNPLAPSGPPQGSVAPPYNPLGNPNPGNAGPSAAPPYNPLASTGNHTNNFDYRPAEEEFTYGYDDPEELLSGKTSPQNSPNLPPQAKWAGARQITTIRDDRSSKKRAAQGANSSFINKSAPFRAPMGGRPVNGGFAKVGNPYANEDNTRISSVSNISASRDWSSIHAFQPPEVVEKKKKDMFARKYSYGGLQQTFLSCIYTGDYKAGKISPGFINYIMASKEELRISKDARDELLNKPISIEQIRLPNDYSSKFDKNF